MVQSIFSYPFTTARWRSSGSTQGTEFHEVIGAIGLHEEDEPPFFHHDQYRNSSVSVTLFELRRLLTMIQIDLCAPSSPTGTLPLLDKVFAPSLTMPMGL
jgi:hypothetical protein